jgi:hypothetical protein
MKGTLHKTESGWEVWYHAKDDLYHGSIRVRILPLHPDEPILVDKRWDGTEVEFEIFDNRQICNCACHRDPNITHFVACCNDGYKTDNLGHVNYYAKLVDQKHIPMKGGEGWDKMLDKAIQDKAETFTNSHYHYRGKDAFIHGYKQGQEDIKGIKYSEEDMRELYAYAKRDDSNLEDYLQALNKQDSEWITMKEGDLTVNFKPMPEFDDPVYPTRADQLREQAWDVIWKDFRANKNASYSWALIEYLRNNYNPPTKKQD